MGLLDRFKGSARDRFAAEVLDVLLGLDTVAEAVYVPEDFRIDCREAGAASGAGPTRVYLSNAFAECEGVSARERSERSAKLASIAALPEVPDTWDGIRPLLRPVLRQAMFGQNVDGPQVPLSRAALPYLAELVVIDLPTAIRYVPANAPDKWGLTAEEVFAAARENLAARAFRGAASDQLPKQPVAIRLADTDGDAYFASLPLLPGWLADMRATSGGQPVAVVSEQNGLLLLGVPVEPKSIAGLAKLALEEYRNAVRPVSPVPYTTGADGAVVPYTVPREDPAWPALREAETALAFDVYGQQTLYLRAKYESEAIETYVGSLIRAESNKDATFFTVAAWTDGIESLLPRADYVALGEDDEMFLLLFDDAIEELELTPEPGLYPARYRVGSWPDTRVMQRLRSRAANP